MVGRPAKSSVSFPIIRRLISPNVRQIDIFCKSHNRLLFEKNQIITKTHFAVFEITKSSNLLAKYVFNCNRPSDSKFRNP